MGNTIILHDSNIPSDYGNATLLLVLSICCQKYAKKYCIVRAIKTSEGWPTMMKLLDEIYNAEINGS